VDSPASEVLAKEPPASGTGPAATGSGLRSPARPRLIAALAALAVVIVVLILALGGGSGPAPPATGAAALVPSDALLYVNVSLDRARPAVRAALRIAQRFPDFPLASAALQTRVGAIVAGGRSVDFGSQIQPWLGNEAALALLNTTTSTAGSLVILDVRSRPQAMAFVRGEGAAARGTYRGTRLYAYGTGTELAFYSHYLLLGQPASVQTGLDVGAGAAPSLAGSGVYQRASLTEPPGRVLDAYASLAGVRRVLAPQGGLIGAFGSLLYQPALQGVTLSLSPAPDGARVQIHSALDTSLVHLGSVSTKAFTPTLQNVMPDGSILVFDVKGLDHLAPQVLSATSTAGVEGGVGPLLTRLGSALSAEGVNIHQITSIFDRETAVAIVPHGAAPTLVIVARAPNQEQIRTELANLEVPLAQLFKPPQSGPGSVPQFNDHTVAGVTDHQLSLARGLEFDYAVFRGLVVISTSSQGIAEVAARARVLAQDPGFRFALAGRLSRLTALVYLDLRQLLSLGEQTGITSSATYRRLKGDLEAISSIGLTSTRSPGQSSAQVSIRVP
jgi:hypothetical protein